MNLQTLAKLGDLLRKRTGLQRFFSVLSTVALTLGSVGASTVTTLAAPLKAPLAQTTNTLHLEVVSARTEPDFPDGPINKGDPVANYKYIIVRDDTGNPSQATTPNCLPATDPDYPANCDWPSIHTMAGGSASAATEIVTQGDQSDFGPGIALPDGDYMISILAENFRIDGQWFTIPLADPGIVTVGMQPYPLPLATLRMQVFEDTSTNGQYDPQIEHGLAGFVGHISDVLAEVTTDWFGNPLCTQYVMVGGHPDPDQPIPGTGGKCLSDANGVITIPNLGPNRYSASVVPSDGQKWIQTATLEGAHDWDTWPMEGDQGYDPELIVNGGAVPVVQIGFVQPTALPNISSIHGEIKGRVVSVKSYLPPAGGDTFEGPVDRPWVALTNLLLPGDPLVYAGRGNADGTFDIQHVPNSDYQITFWDQEQNLLLSAGTVVVANGQVVDMGDFALSHWFSELEGTVFIDYNRDGHQDPGEPGLPGQPVALKSRDNSLVDAGQRVSITDNNGHYKFKQVYPYGYWTVEEVYNDRYYTTGATYQADNQPTETVVPTQGGFVDVPVLNQDGLSARLDWGVHPYETNPDVIAEGFPTNGGIVGTVVYNATRNELDARFSATEDYEAGIPGLTVNLWTPVACTQISKADPNCGPTSSGARGPGRPGWKLDSDGSYFKGTQLDTYTTETFDRPTDCLARDADGNPVVQEFLPPDTGGHDCLDAPLMGNQGKPGEDFPFVNGNYGFGGLTPGDYLVEVVVPDDAFGRPMFKVSTEEDLNVFTGDTFVPQVPPPPCAGPLHTVDVEGLGPDGPDAVHNPGLVDAGGSPYEGQQMPLCNMKLVPVKNGKSIAPIFSYFTDVPLPGRLFGAMVEDLALGTNPKELFYGEKAGIPNAPIGIYDFSGRLAYTLHTDPNGFFEVLLPSTSSYNCPLPAGPCPSVWRLVGNDPGQPGAPNPDYNPQYRTLSSNWQVWPNLTLLADVALLPTAAVLEIPGTQNTHPAACLLTADTPQLFAVSQPYVNGSGSFTIDGQGFGAQGPNSKVTLDGTALTIGAIWNNTHIDVTVPSGTPAGPHQLMITADNGKTTVNGLTFHVLGTGYNPTVFEIGPGKTYTTIQSALEAAASTAQALVVVYPNTPGTFTPLGDYYESIVVHSPVKLQGVGPGGVRGDGSFVLGSIINGQGFANTNFPAWQALVEGLKASPGWSGNQNIYEGQVVYVLARDAQFGAAYKAAIDGLTIAGGDEFGYPSTQAFYVVQGGGLFVNAYARNLQITNNVFQSNGGSYGGAIRIGTPAVGDNQNDNIRIANNRVIANGGSNLTGAIGLFAGTENYEIANNDICGNFSAEYGGGISHFGLSPKGSIHNNRVYFNESYDEGAGIMIAGEPPANPNGLSAGSGPVSIYANILQSNLSNDDGGGLRFLEDGNFPVNVYNNMIVNNVATHEGGGLALDDAPNVRLYNNTIMKNLTTATSAASNGLPAPAGLSTGQNSTALQATLPSSAPNFSNPLMFNNIFWDNRAGYWDSVNLTLAGIGLGGPGDVNPWDMGVFDGSDRLHPTNSLLQQDVFATDGQHNGSNKYAQDPAVLSPYDTTVLALPWRGDPHFFDNVIVALDLPPGIQGDYHISGASPAVDMGAASKAVPPYQQPPSTLLAACDDIDGDGRPNGLGFDAGADEIAGATPNCPSMHIGDLDGTTINVGTTLWRARVTITVHDNTHALVPNATVAGAWSAGDTNGVQTSCTTSNVVGPTFGTCTVQSGRIPNATTNVIFTVTGASNSLPYKPGDNHDPDGDSNGTAITMSHTMHIGDLDWAASNTSTTTWQAIVTITVHDSNHNPVAGATVTGSWINGSGSGSGGTGGTTCSSVTNASGQCTVTRTGISRNRLSMIFTVSNVTTSSLVYQSSANHDPDAPPQNSTGTSITIPRPP